ncbi:pilus assembly PilX family protein [Desulfobacter latus]|uniref:Pilus assembly PilX N-terminal domain-containing protein n=1 Tax=Desulfobacter latus TaxID=2292 RepID=A0A850T4K5_9BACT|nr:PilX N-terminal domain-containing pilus assembly protein [Desulfobacter latus]NWH06703.1 pilus assembly PilX N-terminal domain-containing protein [Desulfobacter latus]
MKFSSIYSQRIQKDMKPLNYMNNQQGFALISTMLFLVLLTVIGIAGLNTTSVELQVTGNERVYRTDFYNQEMSLAVGKLNYKTWLTSAYLTTSESAAYFPIAGTDSNSNGISDVSEIIKGGKVIGSYRVRNNVSTATDITNWEDLADFGSAANHPANKIPALAHRDKPPPGSGYDPKNFEIRRFTITAYSVDDDRKVILQEGVYKAFNKYN